MSKNLINETLVHDKKKSREEKKEVTSIFCHSEDEKTNKTEVLKEAVTNKNNGFNKNSLWIRTERLKNSKTRSKI